jgi:hypothetical protein
MQDYFSSRRQLATNHVPGKAAEYRKAVLWEEDPSAVPPRTSDTFCERHLPM